MFTLPKKRDMDYESHNIESNRIWETFWNNKPIRMPMMIGCNPRILLLNPKINTKGITFREYSEDKDVMLNTYCWYDYYRRHYIPRDAQMGMPDAWTVEVDLQNYHETVWLGSEIEYTDNSVPAASVSLNDDNKEKLFQNGIPNPFSGIYKRGIEFYDYFNERKTDYTFMDRKLGNIGMFGLGTDGPFTLCCNLRGTDKFCMDLYLDSEYALELLDFVTTAAIARIKAFRKYAGQPEKTSTIFLADDSIVLIGIDTYKEFVLPFHKRIVEELTDNSFPHLMHLCGDATRFFPLMHEELNISYFDTGYPIDFANITKEMGSDVCIQGGVKVDILLNESREKVIEETKRIIDEVKPNTNKFIMREANNLPPCVPEENLWAMYETVKKFG